MTDGSGKEYIIPANNGNTGKAGDISLSAKNISLQGNSTITAETQTSGEGGLISVNSSTLNLSGGSQLTTRATSSGKAGAIFLNASTPRDLAITFSGNSLINAATEQTAAGGGQGGTITIGTPSASLAFAGTGRITAETMGTGNGGNINLDGTSINLDSSTFTVKTSGLGTGGNISLNSSDSINLSNGAKINAQATKTIEDIFSKDSSGNIRKDSSGNPIIEITANKGITGDAGNIHLFAKDISLDNSFISAETQTIGLGGQISVDSPMLALNNGAELSVKATSTGNAGDIQINTNPNNSKTTSITFGYTTSLTKDSKKSLINASTSFRGVLPEDKPKQQAQGGSINLGRADTSLSVTGIGSITAETMGNGNGGDINLKGTSINLDSSTFTVKTSGSGSGGSISVDSSKSINLSNGAKINAQTKITTANKGITGVAGSISLSAENVSLQGKSMITAETETSGEGGIIAIDSTTLNLAGGSQLTTEATNSSTSKAGNIYLNNPTDININPFTPRDLTISFSDKDSLINAQTASQGIKDAGKGGDINIGTATKALSINGPGYITAETMGTGNGGNINLKGTSINLDSSTFTVKTSGSGSGGSISLNSSDSINLSNGAKVNAQATKTTEDIFSKNSSGSILKDSSGNPIIEITANKGITGDAGNINLSANNVNLKDKSIITAETQTSGIGGLISVDSNNLNLSGGSQLSTRATSSGNAGSIFLNASTPRDLAIAFSGNSFINAATEQSAAGGGQGGTIKLGTSAKNLSIFGQGFITAETKGSGNGGGIDLNGSSISFDRGAVATAQTSGSGRGGTISVKANTITLDNRAKVSTKSGSGLDASPQPTGPAGSISITAAGPNSLHLRDGSQISSDTSSTIAWGNDKDLANIIIKTPNLTLTGASSISASTSAAAKAGAINLISAFTELAGGSTIATASTGSGAGGNININGTRLQLSGASQIKADGGNFGQAGSINISLSDRLQLHNQSGINASTARSASKEGGANISITLGGDLILSNGTSITATASGKANGGNIKLLLPNGFLLSSFPGAFAGNDILASADAGNGGRIELRALGIFGVNINTFFTPISEASAKSRSGRDGVLAFYIPFLTPDRGVVPIEQPLDPDNDLVRACSPRADGRRAEFTQTGRGGQPSLPGDRPTAAPLLDDLGRPAPRRGLQTSASPPSTSQPAPAAAIPIASAIQLQGYAPRLALPLPPCPEPR